MNETEKMEIFFIASPATMMLRLVDAYANGKRVYSGMPMERDKQGHWNLNNGQFECTRGDELLSALEHLTPDLLRVATIAYFLLTDEKLEIEIGEYKLSLDSINGSDMKTLTTWYSIESAEDKELVDQFELEKWLWGNIAKVRKLFK
jgi:hypothetical protein